VRPYRLLVADLDGTVRSRTRGVTPAVRAAVAGAQAMGVRVSIATGRMWPSAAPWVRMLGADSPVILYNGGQVFDFATGRILWERRLGREAARAALEVVRREPAAQPHLFLNDRVYVERRHPLTDAYAADDNLDYTVVPAFAPLLAEDPHKILVIAAPERIEALGRAVREAGLPVHAVQSEPVYLEILPPDTTKGTALRAMTAALGIDLAEVIAVGDNWNDIEMLEAAGLGVAMGQAPAGVRARARFVCGTSEEDGFREVVERFVLGRAGGAGAG
jgi:Cof subfamily protein (haloacid dehalogenase superfamily)